MTDLRTTAPRPRPRLSTGNGRLDGPARPLRVSDLPALSRFLRAHFPESDGAMGSEAMLAWKYFAPDTAWAAATSFVLERDGCLMAHAGFCPATLAHAAAAPVRAATIIDWAADPRVPGSGLAAYRHAMQLAEVTFLVGGAPATRRITSALGFRPRVVGRFYERWVRPFGEFLRRDKSWRAPLRLLHGAAHLLLDGRARDTGWSARPLARLDEERVGATRPTGLVFAERSAVRLNHWLRCPSRTARAYLVSDREGPRGYALASVGSWEAKIVDLRIDGLRGEDWVAACGAVTAALAADPRVCRIGLFTTTPHLTAAAAANGYWLNRVEPVTFFDPGKVIPADVTIDLQYLDTDLAYYEP